MELKLSITSENVLKWLLFSLAFTPLVVTSFAMFPFVVGKTVFIRLVIALFWLVLSGMLFIRRRDSARTLPRLDLGFLKNPIFILLSVFMLLGLVSSLFAPVLSKALLGTVERGEGYIHLVFLTFLFAGSLMVFKKSEWLAFFQLSALVGIVVGVDAIWDFVQTGERPNGSFINNPAFIAEYMLFVIFAALIVLTAKGRGFWRWAGLAATFTALAAIAVTNTRGVVIGFVFGVLGVALYFAVLGAHERVRIFRRQVSLRRAGISALVFIALSASLFALTINSPVWDRVPGLDRLSQISLEDNTVQSRLITMKVALRSVNPADAGLYRFLFGYGPDNFNVAYNEYLDPAVQEYESLWFDRAHNKVLDVLVMHGLLGFIAYISLWYFVVRLVIRHVRSPESAGDGERVRRLMVGASALFFAVSYFVQNLFLFDQTVTYVPLFMFLGFVAHLRGDSPSAIGEKTLSRLKGLVPVVAVALSAAVYMYSFIPLYQSSVFVSALRTGSAIELSGRLGSITEPYNFAQPEIRFRVLSAASNLVTVEEALPFVERALELEEEVLARDLLEPRYFQVTGFVYDTLGRLYGRPELYQRAEEHLREAVLLAPGRQEAMFLLAGNLVNQGRLDEAHALTEEMLAFAPGSSSGQFYYAAIFAPVDYDGSYGTTAIMNTLFREKALVVDREAFTLLDDRAFRFIRNSYNAYLAHFFAQRDEKQFAAAMRRAAEIERLLEEAQGLQAEQGLVTVPIRSRSSELEQGLEVFLEGGWGAIRLQ